MSSLQQKPSTEQWPAWAMNVIRRLRCLTKGRYHCIIDIKQDGIVDSLTILSSGKVEQVNPDKTGFQG